MFALLRRVIKKTRLIGLNKKFIDTISPNFIRSVVSKIKVAKHWNFFKKLIFFYIFWKIHISEMLPETII